MDLIFSTAAYNKVHASLHRVIHTGCVDSWKTFGVGKLFFLKLKSQYVMPVNPPSPSVVVEQLRSFWGIFWKAGFGEMVGSEAYGALHSESVKADRNHVEMAPLMVSLYLLQGPCVCHQSRHFIWADNPSAGRKVSPRSWHENVLVLPFRVASVSTFDITFLGACVWVDIYLFSEHYLMCMCLLISSLQKLTPKMN